MTWLVEDNKIVLFPFHISVSRSLDYLLVFLKSSKVTFGPYILSLLFTKLKLEWQKMKKK